MKQIFPVLFFLGWMVNDLQAQQSIVASGSDVSGSGGSVSYSVGLSNYTSKSGSGGMVNEGVQLPFEVYVVVGIQEERITLDPVVFPNPATDFIELYIDIENQESLIYDLFDINGKIIESQRVVDNSTIINMESLSGGTYYLKVRDQKKTIKTFRIIKHY